MGLFLFNNRVTPTKIVIAISIPIVMVTVVNVVWLKVGEVAVPEKEEAPVAMTQTVLLTSLAT